MSEKYNRNNTKLHENERKSYNYLKYSLYITVWTERYFGNLTGAFRGILLYLFNIKW